MINFKYNLIVNCNKQLNDKFCDLELFLKRVYYIRDFMELNALFGWGDEFEGVNLNEFKWIVYEW